MPTHSARPDDSLDQRGLITDILAVLTNGPTGASASLAPTPDADARRIVINGSVILNGVQNIEQLYDELQAEARRRNAGDV